MFRKADQIKVANLVDIERPGILQAFMQPVKLKDQVRAGAPRADLRFSPEGKTLVGGVQWGISMQRPGLAQPLIVAKEEARAAAQVARMLDRGGVPNEVKAGVDDRALVAVANRDAGRRRRRGKNGAPQALSGWARWFS